MMNHNNPRHKKQSEGKRPVNQLQTIFQYLPHVATAAMTLKATGVLQKNICSCKRDLEKAGRLCEVVKAICKKTSFKAWYLTTDPIEAADSIIQFNPVAL